MLRQDKAATEQLMGPFVLIASFILITVMVITSMAAFLQTASGNWDEVKGTKLIGTTEYTLRNPLLGWNITNDNVTDRWDHEADENVAFYEDAPGESDEIVCGFVRDNAYFGKYLPGEVPFYDWQTYEDFIMIYTEFGWFDNDDWAISYETIAANKIVNSNVSLTEFGLRHNTTFALIITVDGPPEVFGAGLWSNNFNIKIGLPDYDDDIGYTSMWTVLGQVMTASLPDVGYEVNMIIGATVYAGLGMVVFTVITRALPSWLSGG